MMASRERFCRLSAKPYVILPSLLACDFAHLEDQIRAVEQAGCCALHLDIMDGHFVPNLSFGIPVVEAIRRSTDLILDVHLMLSCPEEFYTPFRRAGADALTFHIEAVADELFPGHHFARNGLSVAQAAEIPSLTDTVFAHFDQIHALGAAAGISLNPPTEIETLAPFCAPDTPCDNVLVMGVMPGFGGQKFSVNALEKLAWLRQNAPASTLRSVDGGVNAQTISACQESGANGLIMGTAIYDGIQPAANFRQFSPPPL